MAEDNGEADEEFDLEGSDTDEGDFDNDEGEGEISYQEGVEEDGDGEIDDDGSGKYQQGGRKKMKVPLSATPRDWG